MTYSPEGFVPLIRQLFARDIADAFAELARQKYPTAKHLARAWNIDKSTAENLFKGHLSVPTLAKAIAAEGGELWDLLGEAITGETYAQRQERRLQIIIREADNARQNLHVLRTRAALLDERARELGNAFHRSDDEPGRPRSGRSGSSNR